MQKHTEIIDRLKKIKRKIDQQNKKDIVEITKTINLKSIKSNKQNNC